MGLTDSIKNMTSNFKQGTKNVTTSLIQKILRLVSSLLVAAVLGLIIQEMMQSGTLTLVFLVVLLTSLGYLLLARFSILQILIFDLICVLIISLLRLYIMVAP